MAPDMVPLFGTPDGNIYEQVALKSHQAAP